MTALLDVAATLLGDDFDLESIAKMHPDASSVHVPGALQGRGGRRVKPPGALVVAGGRRRVQKASLGAL